MNALYKLFCGQYAMNSTKISESDSTFGK